MSQMRTMVQETLSLVYRLKMKKEYYFKKQGRRRGVDKLGVYTLLYIK